MDRRAIKQKAIGARTAVVQIVMNKGCDRTGI